MSKVNDMHSLSVPLSPERSFIASGSASIGGLGEKDGSGSSSMQEKSISSIGTNSPLLFIFCPSGASKCKITTDVLLVGDHTYLCIKTFYHQSPVYISYWS